MLRFRLRTLLLATTALFVWLGFEADQIHRQRSAVAAIERLHGSVRYRDWPSALAVGRRLEAWLGRDAVAIVDAVYLGGSSIGDNDLAWVEDLPRLRTIVLTSSPITDAGLDHLHRLSDLESIDVRFTEVTEAGVALLRRRLPRATVFSKSDLE
jgi:hypothetical protein